MHPISVCIQLLFKELESRPQDPYLYFQIGQSYNSIQDYENAYLYYKKAFSLPFHPEASWIQAMATAFLNVMNHTGRSVEAVAFFKPIYAHFENDADFYCGMGSAYLHLHPPKPQNAMTEYSKALQCPTAREEGANTFIPNYNIGLINEMVGNLDSACQFYQRAADLGYSPAVERLAAFGEA